jgi:hypothetical protein
MLAACTLGIAVALYVLIRWPLPAPILIYYGGDQGM